MNSESTSKNIKKQSPLAENILETIQKDDVRMRPKWHFILNISLLVIGTILAGLSLLYLVSFIVFILRQNGSWFMPSFGAQGWSALFISLPWILIFLALLFVIIVGFLVKKYSFAYGRPLLYSALGIIIFASVGGFYYTHKLRSWSHPKTCRYGSITFSYCFYSEDYYCSASSKKTYS
jgi:hypothetical protein